MIKMKIGVILLLAAFCFADSGRAQHHHGSHQAPASAGGDVKGGEPSAGDEASSRRTFLLEGGIKAAFGIVPMADHKKMLQDMKMKVEVNPQATHNIAVTLTDTGSNLPIANAVVKMKVISPGGKEEVKLLDQIPAMSQSSGDFTLSEKGRYQILILFKAEGKKRSGGFYYRVN